MLISIASLSRQTLQWLAESELDNVSIGIAHHREIAHHAAGINWFLNENLLFARLLGNSIHFCA